MKQKIITIVFFLLEGGCSFLAWQSLYRSVLVPGSSLFFLPSVFFSALAVLLLVSVVLFPLRSLRVLAIVLALLPVFTFGWPIASFVACMVAALLLYQSLTTIDQELSEHLTVRFFSSARMGTFLLSIGFSVIIVAGHSALIIQLPAEKLLPRFSLAEGSGKWVLQIAGKINPAISRLETEDLSVDEFLLSMMPEDVTHGKSSSDFGETSSTPANDVGNGTFHDALQAFDESSGMTAEQTLDAEKNASADFQKTLFLREMKSRLAHLIGRDVSGDERAKAVLSEIINAKIFGTFSSVQTEGSSIDTLRAIISLLLFVSLLSVGSFFGIAWAFVAWILFWILQGGSIIAIRKIPVEAEQIVLVD